MKKTMRRLFAILMTLAIAITAIPTMEAKAAEEYMIESATLPVDTVTLNNENPVVSHEGVEFEISGINESVSYVQAIYICEEVNEYVEALLYESEEAGVYTGKLTCDPDAKSGVYKLSYAFVYFEGGSSTRIYTNIPESSVIVVNNIVDNEPPVIEGVAFEQNGQTFKYGTDAVIEITAENIADAEGGAGIDFNSDDAYALIAPVVGIGSRMVHFVPQPDGTFKANLDVDELRNTEWYVYEIYVADWMDNKTYYYPIENGQYWYFYVEDENGVCNTERTITVNFCDKNDEVLKDEVVTSNTGEIVLADLLDEIPTYETDLGFVGWKCEETGQMLKEDVIFISTSTETEFNFYPVTEKVHVTVDLRILDEDGSWNWTGYEDYFVDADMTYKDLAAILPIPSAVNGCTFVEWELFGYEWNDLIESDWVDFKAVYDKKIIEMNCFYMNSEGKLEGDNISSIFEADEKVTYKDILDAIPNYETYEGVTFVEWRLRGEEIDLTKEVEDTWLELRAYYDKYPVTIERTYVDTTGKTKTDKVTKLYPAGTSLADVYEEYAVTPSDASTALEISSWEVTGGLPEAINEDNNYLSLKAEYADCIIIDVEYYYIAPMDDHGVVKYENITEVVSKEIAADAEELKAYLKENVEPKINATHYEGYVVSGWEYYDVVDTYGDGYFDYVMVESKINMDDVITLYLDIEPLTDEGMTYVYLVDAGETIELPWQYNGNYLFWLEPFEDGWNKIDGYAYTIPKDSMKGDIIRLIGEPEKKISGEADTSAEIVDENNVLPDGVVIRPIELKEGNEYTESKKLVESKIENVENLAIYDITLVGTDGVLIEELNNKIKVTLDLPFELTEGNEIVTFRVEDEKLIECETTVSNGKLTFLTNHFSTYVFVERSTSIAVPPTGDTTNVLPYMLLLLFGAGVFMVGNKRRNFVR
ncbi:MAG: hypothetical protein IJE49_10385 [Agathobacter sp.]|nr:hypothetical protein [Agathobacter sp.]